MKVEYEFGALCLCIGPMKTVAFNRGIRNSEKYQISFRMIRPDGDFLGMAYPFHSKEGELDVGVHIFKGDSDLTAKQIESTWRHQKKPFCEALKAEMDFQIPHVDEKGMLDALKTYQRGLYEQT